MNNVPGLSTVSRVEFRLYMTQDTATTIYTDEGLFIIRGIDPAAENKVSLILRIVREDFD